MGHKAGTSFFKAKRPWSERKDLILAYYLKPYLPKIATQKRPILLVDGFAGPGQFDDGKPGSPLIMCGIAKEANAKPLQAPVNLLAVEPDTELHGTLATHLQSFTFAKTKNSTLTNALDEIEKAASKHSIFLYLDPWTVEGLEWDALARVFAHLAANRSVEVLVNFNARSFVRRGLSALKQAAPEDMDDGEDEPDDLPTKSKLNVVVGGDWWEQTILGTSGFPEQVSAIASGFCQRLSKHFREVCMHPLLAEPHHRVPKYHLIFGSRSPHALRLMNEAMALSREKLAESALSKDQTMPLFETRPLTLVPDESAIPSIVLGGLSRRMRRGELMEQTMRAHFGVYREKAIRQAITQMIKNGQIQSATGKSRINDDVEVWKTQA